MTKRVLITGAASGLGAELAAVLLARGDVVHLTDIHESADGRAADLLRAYPRTATYRRLDVTSDEDWAAARDAVLAAGGLDLLVNNAGVAVGGTIEKTSIESWRGIVEVSLLGVVRGCRTAVEVFDTTGRGGRILNIASVAAFADLPRMAAYNTVKAGVHTLSATLRNEFRGRGISVSVACPSFFRTGLAESLPREDEESADIATLLITTARRDAPTIARRIVRGVDRGRFRILTDVDSRIVAFSQRFAPGIYRWVVGRSLPLVIRTGGWPISRGRGGPFRRR